ncbi:hypothetical protein Hamer_G004308 [Homarus americanus]|uniref:Uncharacterized protein n=1 Tax=Homarus americanus TaxID=6706 RepID=A0A8J5JNT2_HOMAM|nr:hypothetical protein Hamer_G004308 [Homarus americanus]
MATCLTWPSLIAPHRNKAICLIQQSLVAPRWNMATCFTPPSLMALHKNMATCFTHLSLKNTQKHGHLSSHSTPGPMQEHGHPSPPSTRGLMQELDHQHHSTATHGPMQNMATCHIPPSIHGHVPGSLITAHHHLHCC